MCVLAILVTAGLPARADDCFADLARTRGYSLGLPERAVPTADGRTVIFVRSGARDTRLRLFAYDVAAHKERELLKPAEGPEHLSAQEKARRERARMTLTGITWFALAKDGHSLVAAQADRLYRVALPGGEATPVPGTSWIAPRLSPDGRFLAAVRDNDLHVIELASGADRQITHGGTDVVTNGVAEFAAAEELDREDGTWWSPDGSRLVVETADNGAVEQHYITDPAHPDAAPVGFRYPRAGTANARVSLVVMGKDGGGVVPIRWDADAFPYVARVIWPAHGRLSLVVLNRAQTEERVLAADPATGATTTLLAEHDPAWLDLAPEVGRPPTEQGALPHWLPDGAGFLWAAERGGQWQLELRRADGALDHTVTPAGFPFVSLDDVDAVDRTAVVSANADPIGLGVFRVPLRGGQPAPLLTAPGLHHARFGEGHSAFVDSFQLADGGAGSTLYSADSQAIAALPSVAAVPPALPAPAFERAGPLEFQTVVLRPHDYVAGRQYPVVLSVYAGPTVKVVERSPRAYFEDQCLADHGFIVAALDGRGTPGRGRDWERATQGDLIDLPLADQVAGLRALAAKHPDMDLGRAGVTGWSFGGYFTLMAVIRHPELFRAAVAGAPVVDWADYDTAYTERYLGLPSVGDAYRKNSVLTYAAGLARPLLIMHGITDDNVYFAHTMKLTGALLAAGKPYDLLLLPGTHLLPDPMIRARVDETRARFLGDHLK